MKKFLIALAIMLLIPISTYAAPVDLELSLLVDVSSSIGGDDFSDQRAAYVAAFNSPEVWEAIDAGEIGQIAVNMVYWSDSDGGQAVVVDWTLIDSPTAMNNFADLIGSASRTSNGLTGIGDALIFGAQQFELNDHEGTRLVMDVSGYGVNNDGISSSNGRDIALGLAPLPLSGGIYLDGVTTINGIVLTRGADDPEATAVYTHYESQVIGGDGAFLMYANSFADFEVAIKEKLIKEINPVPAPAAILLFGVGLLGLTGTGRRRK